VIRVHELDADLALVDQAGNQLIQIAPTVCDNNRCTRHHLLVIPEDEMADTITDAVQDTLRRLGLSGRAIAS
jgi:hypothetical protein